jgi:hypothetical protein
MSCTPTKVHHTENHVVIAVFKKAPIGVHEEISPRYYGILENGDTIPVSQITRPNDTIQYTYVEKR